MKRIPKWLTILGAFGSIALILGSIAGYSLAKHPDSSFTKSYVIPVVKPVVDFISGFEKHKNVNESEPQFSLSPDEIQGAFLKDEAAASILYEGKILKIKGTISSIASPTDTNIVILLLIESDPVSNISCQMDPAFNDRLKSLAAGSVISIKGICNGAKKDDLLGSVDVLLNRCVIVQ